MIALALPWRPEVPVQVSSARPAPTASDLEVLDRMEFLQTLELLELMDLLEESEPLG